MARPIGSKNKTIETIKTTEILNSVSGLSLENVSNKLSAVQVEVQHTLAGLSTKLTEQLAVLSNVENAIALKKDELKQLRDIEVTANTMDDLTAQIESQRKDWQDEQVEKVKEFEKKRLEREQTWAREEEQHNYRRNQERQKVEDTFNLNMITKEKENRNKQEALEKVWSERENNLKAREQELIDLRNQVSAFPALMKAEVDKVSSIVKANITNDYETKIKINAAEMATDKKLSTQEIASLNKTISDLNNQINSLKDQLSKAHLDVKEISQKALEAAASRETVANLQRAFDSVQNGKTK